MASPFISTSGFADDLIWIALWVKLSKNVCLQISPGSWFRYLGHTVSCTEWDSLASWNKLYKSQDESFIIKWIITNNIEPFVGYVGRQPRAFKLYLKLGPVPTCVRKSLKNWPLAVQNFQRPSSPSSILWSYETASSVVHHATRPRKLSRLTGQPVANQWLQLKKCLTFTRADWGVEMRVMPNFKNGLFTLLFTCAN